MMLINIDMEFIQAFNPLYAPLYAFPIALVVSLIVVVYALGFKSPIQPPSFDGLEEDRKFTKKRKTRDTQKSKSISNGKVNGIAVTKGKNTETSKRRDTTAVTDKLHSQEKVSVEKKAVKKSKSQSEKKLVQEKKKEIVTFDELNEDGWVQLVSKKSRKNRKKEDIVPTIKSASQEPVVNIALETGKKNDDKDLPKPTISDVISETDSFDKKTQLMEEKQKKKKPKNEMISKPDPDSSMNMTAPDETKIVDNIVENLNEPHSDIPALAEDSSKSKKKKKKQVIASPPDIAVSEIDSSAITPSSNSAEKIPILQKSDSIREVPVDTATDSKSNVAFDELAGLYPETKEKKKKKVRRDH